MQSTQPSFPVSLWFLIVSANDALITVSDASNSDIEFDLEEDKSRCLHGLSPSSSAQFSPADVLRVHQIFEKPQFFVDGPPKSSGIIQGACGNCWFLSALSNIATIPGLIEKSCVAVSGTLERGSCTE